MPKEFEIGDIVQSAWGPYGMIIGYDGWDEEEEDDNYLFFCFEEGIQYYMTSHHLYEVDNVSSR
jgi:hypothetical protein